MYEDDNDYETEAKVNRFLVSWCVDGFEAVIDCTAILEETTFLALKGEKAARGIPLPAMIMRARANGQRHYEIYSIDAPCTEEEMTSLCFGNQQGMVDLIRKKGHCLWGNPAPKRTAIV